VKLDVRVLGKRIAQLYREGDEYVLKYLPAAEPSDFVSLAMPVEEGQWRWPRDLHPFFRQNLPEGFLLSIIREDFGPVLDGTDLSLLAVVGGMGIGRVTVTPEGAEPGAELDPLAIEELAAADNTAENFAQLVRKYARAAISGAVPKFLAPEIGADGPEPLGKSTLRTSRHIIKGSDNNTPYLGFNEYYAMQVLERLNVVPVAKTRMSDDGRVLIVDRFDVDPNGMPTHGVEDACSLLGLPPHEKYATTMERVLEATRVYLPPEQAYSQHVHLGWHVLANYVVRNADCHSKNIALYYTQRFDVAYTPVYDIVTTQAYPRYATNPPGLSVEGRKSWAQGKSLEKFFKSRLGISPRVYAAMVEQLCDSAVTVGREMIRESKNETRWREITAQMLHAWNDGMASLRSVRSESRFKGLTADIEAAAGLPEPQRPPRDETIERSALLARGRRS
jgi:serine/threonine-protein kinase HipA